MNEFQQMSQMEELQALKEIVPSWKSAKLEPFVGPAAPDAIPVWKGVNIDQEKNTGGSAPSAQGPLVRFVAGVVVGSSFVPKIVNTDGTTEDIP